MPRSRVTKSSPNCSYACTIVSVSERVAKVCPAASSSWASSAKLYISPLKTTATVPVSL